MGRRACEAWTAGPGARRLGVVEKESDGAAIARVEDWSGELRFLVRPSTEIARDMWFEASGLTERFVTVSEARRRVRTLPAKGMEPDLSRQMLEIAADPGKWVLDRG